VVDYETKIMASSLFTAFEGVLEPDSAEGQLIERLDPSRMPRHIAIIMDGNGRWARLRSLPRVEGHRAGIQAVKDSVEFGARLGISALTLYAFSSENWKRPKKEVDTLWTLLREYLQKELPTLQENNISFDCIGRIQQLPRPVRKRLELVREVTAGNSGMRLILALSYSGRKELVDAVNRILEKGTPPPVTEEVIEENLYTAGLPEPDLLIRSSGEMRVSNFLLWQIAYSEIHVTDVLWPDFRGMNLLEAIEDFQQRERRFGGIYSSSAS
jgi:undecaprenyl diphosphate synthase